MTELPDQVLSAAGASEEEQTAYLAETDTEGEDEEDIDLDKLQPLTTKLASQSKFPVGCKVWCKARNSKIQPKILKAKAAVVVEVYFYFGTMQTVYKVKAEAPTKHETILYEHQLVYAMNCPVCVENLNTNSGVDGIIVSPSTKRGNDGCRVVTYAVQFSEEGGGIIIEQDVAAERIKYRDNGVESSRKGETRGEKLETSSVIEGGLAIEEKEEAHNETREDLPKTAETNNRPLSSVHAVSSDNKHSDRTKSLVTADRWQPPTSAQKRSAEFEAIERSSKLVKIENDKSLARKVVYKIVVPPWVPQMKGGQKCSSLSGSLFGEY